MLVLTFQVQAADGDLIDLLRKKGYINSDEAKELKEKYPQSGPMITTGSKNALKLTISGQLQLRFTDIRSEIKVLTDANDNSMIDSGELVKSDLPLRSSLSIRRARLGLLGTLKNNYVGYLEIDLDESSSLKTAYIGYKGDGIFIRVGWDKAPFGLEETISSSKIKTIERSIMSDYFTNSTKIGGERVGLIGGERIGIFADLMASENVSFSLALTNSSPDYSSSNNYDEFSIYARGRLNRKIGEVDLMLGIDFALAPQSLYVWDERGIGEDTNTFNRDVDGYGRVKAWTTYARATIQDGFSFYGAYTEGEIEAGETKREPRGYVLGVSVRKGKLEPVIAYSKLNVAFPQASYADFLPKDVPSIKNANEFTSIYLGLNYYLRGDDVRFSIGLEKERSEKARIGKGTDAADPLDDTSYDSYDSKVVRAQVQFLF